MAIISGLHTNIFRVTRALQKSYQLTSEGEILIIKKNSTEICFDEKMENKSGRGFLPTTKFYKISNNNNNLAS